MRFNFAAMNMLAGFFLSAGVVFAQGTEVPFGGLSHDTTLPVEVAADNLQIDQSDGSAEFTGNVTIGQGEMRISAQKVRVEYSSGQNSSSGEIEKLLASGNVLLVNGAEAAEADSAVYTIGSGQVVMVGNVVLTQGQNALAAERMLLNLGSGTATMSGRVRTILQSGGE